MTICNLNLGCTHHAMMTSKPFVNGVPIFIHVILDKNKITIFDGKFNVVALKNEDDYVEFLERKNISVNVMDNYIIPTLNNFFKKWRIK